MTNTDDPSTPRGHSNSCEEELTAAGELERYEELLRNSLADAVPREDEPASFQAARLMRRLFSEADTPSEPRIPASLGRFQIRELLGTGRFGVVWRAFDPNTLRDVAIKVVRPNPVFDVDVRRRFLQECHLAARISHPGIVPVYDVSSVGDCLYLVMPVCAGPSLEQWIREQSHPVPIRTAIEIARQLAVAVHAGHTCGVIHRDLKPGNVIVTGFSDGRPDVRIIDFGLSVPTDTALRDTRGSFVAGTPAYMAPEQAEGLIDAICPATDVFALGAILYELLTGTPPFFAETLPAVLDRLENESAVPPGKLRSDVDRDLETVCLQCLAHSPIDRYQTAQELADDLERLSSGEPVTAESPTFHQRINRWASRSRTRTALAHTSAAINVLLLIWSIVAVRVSRWAMRDDPTADRSIFPMLIPLLTVIVPLHCILIWLSLRLRSRQAGRSALGGVDPVVSHPALRHRRPRWPHRSRPHLRAKRHRQGGRFHSGRSRCCDHGSDFRGVCIYGPLCQSPLR